MKKPQILRERPDHELEIINEYAPRIGRVLWEWNSVHNELFDIFESLTPSVREEDHTYAPQVWHLFQTDDAKRRLIETLAHDRLKTSQPEIYENLRWLLDQLREIAPYRNIAAHVALQIIPMNERTHTLPGMATKEQHWLKHRMITADYPKFWEEIAGDLYALEQYASELWFRLHSYAQSPWPDRPELLSLPSIREVNTRVDRRLQTPEPNPQPSSSLEKP